MALKRLTLQSFRHFGNWQLDCAFGFNLITGGNGKGKTTVLEAMYVLSLMRSFRSDRHGSLIQTDQPWFCLYAELTDGQTLAIQRWRQNRTLAKVNGDVIQSKADMAYLLPLQLINPDSHRLIEGSPEWRRRYVDWGLFYTEGSFLNLWRQYKQLIKQRNALLKTQPQHYEALFAWDNQLIALGQGLHELRSAYVQQLEQQLQRLALDLNYPARIGLTYRPGWRGELSEALKQDFDVDRKQGFTHSGPHRADVYVTIDGRSAQAELSRGQQKVLVVLMQLAQGLLYEALKGQSCIYLIDDLTAELDRQNTQRLIDVLTQSQCQVFVTAIEAQPIMDLIQTASKEGDVFVQHMVL